MAWVVDSCILLDLALKDPQFGLPAALLLENLRDEGLVVCPVSVVEITPQFGGQVRNVREFLAQLGTEPGAAWLDADTDSAAAGWTRYVQQKHARTIGKRPLADILIGGFACRFQGLVTRNPDHFSAFFPGLVIRQPEVPA